MSTNTTINNFAEQSKSNAAWTDSGDQVQVVDVAIPAADADPIERLRYDLAGACSEVTRTALFHPLPTRGQLINALDKLARFTRGDWPTDKSGHQWLGGLAAMLDWYFTLDEQEAEFEREGGFGDGVVM